jgi:hypothetical protein
MLAEDSKHLADGTRTGAIEADTDHILPRTGYIPTNEPTSLLAQGISMGFELHC